MNSCDMFRSQHSVPHRNTRNWNTASLNYILNNERYVGDALLQKFYTTGNLPFRKEKNKGQRTMYYVQNSHAGIISKARFDAAKSMQARRKKRNIQPHGLTKLLICQDCGHTFRQVCSDNNVYWSCSYQMSGHSDCQRIRVDEEDVNTALMRMIEILHQHCDSILIPMIKALEKLKSKADGTFHKLYEIDKTIAEINNQLYVLTKLQLDGILLASDFAAQNNELTARLSRLRTERMNLLRQNKNREVFDRVQAEMARRTSKRRVKEKGTKTESGKYSSKYALTDMLICGHCGTPYRRCTWVRKGEKKIVWRCISRLDYGKKYCPDSSTIEEGALQNAIVTCIKQVLQDESGYASIENIKRHVSLYFGKDDENSTAADEARAAELIEAITQAASSGQYTSQMQSLVDELNRVKAVIAEKNRRQSEAGNSSDRIEDIMAAIEKLKDIPMTFDNQAIRQIIACIKVMAKDEILIIFKGGFERSVKLH